MAMATTTNGYFPLPALADTGAAKRTELNNILEAADTVLKDVVDKKHTQATDAGTSSSTFQVGTGGPKLKNVAGEVQHRNAADTADANVKGATINASTGFQKAGVALAAADLTENGAGTTATTFKLGSAGNEVTQTVKLLSGAGATQEVGFQVVAGVCQIRNNGDAARDANARYIVIPVNGTLVTGDQGPWVGFIDPFKVLSVMATVKTVSTVGAVQVDIEKSTDNGGTFTTIMTTAITIDQDERSTATATTPAVVNAAAASFAANNILRIYIDGVGVGSANLSVTLKVR